MEKPIRQNAGFSHFGPPQDALDNQWAIQMVEFMAQQIDALQRRVESLERRASTLEEKLPIPPGHFRLAQ